MRVFATSEAYDGALGGLSGADAKCQSAADAAKLGGKFLAWLADGVKGPWDRLSPLKTLYQRVDGELLADSWEALQKPMLKAAIVDEHGMALSQQTAWTGLSSAGVLGAKGHCKAWTSADGLDKGDFGVFSASPGDDWQGNNSDSCAATMHLLCFEVVNPK